MRCINVGCRELGKVLYHANLKVDNNEVNLRLQKQRLKTESENG